MLHTDLHNPSVRRHMTKKDWLRMNKGTLQILLGVNNYKFLSKRKSFVLNNTQTQREREIIEYIHLK